MAVALGWRSNFTGFGMYQNQWLAATIQIAVIRGITIEFLNVKHGPCGRLPA